MKIIGNDGREYVFYMRRRGDGTSIPVIRRMRYDVEPNLMSEARLNTWRRWQRVGEIVANKKGMEPIVTRDGKVRYAPRGPAVAQQLYKGLPAAGEHRSFVVQHREELHKEVSRSLGVSPEEMLERLSRFFGSMKGLA
jgi:hypothetical protein